MHEDVNGCEGRCTLKGKECPSNGVAAEYKIKIDRGKINRRVLVSA